MAQTYKGSAKSQHSGGRPLASTPTPLRVPNLEECDQMTYGIVTAITSNVRNGGMDFEGAIATVRNSYEGVDLHTWGVAKAVARKQLGIKLS